MTISFIIPAYNEAARLPATLAKIKNFFAGSSANFKLKEIVIVDDGSTDDTTAVAQAWASDLPIKTISYPLNRGKGYAVRQGVMAATGELIFIYDADAAAPPGEISKLVEALTGADIAIGSRFASLSTGVQMSAHRRLMGFIFHLWCWPLIPGIKDASCGAKLFRRAAARALFQEQQLDRFAFDIEILWLARRHGYQVKEVPINWRAVPGSKIRLIFDGGEMFWAVLGLYKRQLIS